MAYRVCKYIDQIKKVKDDNPRDDYYMYFGSYEEAKEFLVGRHKNKILRLEKELKDAKIKLPKLEALQEK